MSKVRKNISISEEAAEKLDEQSNASQYIEDLILGKIEREAPWKELEYRIDELKQLLKQSPAPSEEVSKPDIEPDTPQLVEYSVIFTNTGEVMAKYLDKEAAEGHITQAIENGGLDDEFTIRERVLK